MPGVKNVLTAAKTLQEQQDPENVRATEAAANSVRELENWLDAVTEKPAESTDKTLPTAEVVGTGSTAADSK